MPTAPYLSGARFVMAYHLTGTEADARAKAHALCLETISREPVRLTLVKK